jgi:hypothetical protein
MSLDLDFKSETPSYDNVNTWIKGSVFAAVCTGIASITIVALGSLPANTVAIDVARTISGEALLLGVCTVTSMINSYALYQFSRAKGSRE